MSTTVRIPFSGVPESFTTQLGAVTYQFAVAWRDDPGGEGGWFLDIGDANDVPILQGVPLITGADLLEQFAYLGLGFQLWVQTNQSPDAVPTFDNLGGDSNVFAIISGP